MCNILFISINIYHTCMDIIICNNIFLDIINFNRSIVYSAILQLVLIIRKITEG